MNQPTKEHISSAVNEVLEHIEKLSSQFLQNVKGKSLLQTLESEDTATLLQNIAEDEQTFSHLTGTNATNNTTQLLAEFTEQVGNNATQQYLKYQQDVLSKVPTGVELDSVPFSRIRNAIDIISGTKKANIEHEKFLNTLNENGL